MNNMCADAKVVFENAFKALLAAGKREVVAYAGAYVALEKAGFVKDDNCCYVKPPVIQPDAKGKGVYSSVSPDPTTIKNLQEWMDANNIPNQVPSEKLHVTVLYSERDFSGYQPRSEMTVVKPLFVDWDGKQTNNYSLMRLGPDNKAIVLVFRSDELECQFYQGMSQGASWTYPDKVTHMTLTYEAPDDFSLQDVKLPEFSLVFEPEVVEPLVDDWAGENGLKKFEMTMDITKTDDDQQVIYGWASVIEENGEPLVDRQGDVIEEGELVQAAHEFMKSYRQSKEMHNHSQQDGVGNIGTVVESIVFTPDVQKALGIDLKRTGWFIGVKIENEDVWKKIKSGEYRAFSIGGSGTREPVE